MADYPDYLKDLSVLLSPEAIKEKHDEMCMTVMAEARKRVAVYSEFLTSDVPILVIGDSCNADYRGTTAKTKRVIGEPDNHIYNACNGKCLRAGGSDQTQIVGGVNALQRQPSSDQLFTAASTSKRIDSEINGLQLHFEPENRHAKGVEFDDALVVCIN